MIDKIFPRKLNRSKDARIQDKTEMYDAVNISIDDFDGSQGGADGTGDAGVIKPAKGNAALNQAAGITDEGEFVRVIGSVADEVNNEVYLFVFSSVVDKQGVYKISSNETVSIVYVSEHFNFQSNGFVKGDIVYKSDGQVMLFFTDGVNEPRKLLIDKSGAYPADNSSAIRKIDFITACPKTPMHPPTFEFVSDPTKTVNFRSVEGFQFAYQCIYKSGEESAISTYSNVAVPPPFLTQGSLPDPLLEAANKIEIKIPRVVNQIENFTENVESIRLLVRIGNEGGFFSVSEKSVLNPITDALEDSVEFDFYNDSVTTGVPQEDQNKLNDAAPRKVSAQTIVNDRLIYGNYEEGYQTPQVTANFTTRNIQRPEDFVDLRIGVKSFVAPAFAEENEEITVTLNGEDFDAVNAGALESVINRRAAYQFDLSDLPSVLPSNSVAELSFSISPDNNFHVYDSLGNFHAFKNNGFGLGLDTGDSKSIQDPTRVMHSGYLVGNFGDLNGGQPTVYQPASNGVHSANLTWESVDPAASASTTGNIVFGTSPSNPFIIPSELITFKVRFKTTQEFSGSENVKSLIEDILVKHFSNGESVGAIEGIIPQGNVDEILLSRTPEVSIDQLMDSSNGFGLISDNDGRANTVVTCFTDGDVSGAYSSNVAPVGFFAINKAKAKFQLRHSRKINDAVEASEEYNVGPVFTLHLEALNDIETVTMIPRITRSGNRGWIYLTRDFVSDPNNQEAIRRVCMYGRDFIPDPENGVGDCNIFFLNRNFAPITGGSGNALSDATGTSDTLGDHRIKASYFLNAGALEVLSADYDGSEFYDGILTFNGYQGTSLVQFGELSSGISEALTKVGGTELDSDFRVTPGGSAYPIQTGLAYGEGDDPDSVSGHAEVNPLKFRNIGYINLNEAGSIVKYADTNGSGFTYSIVDGEAGIRQNYEQGRLNPSYWYGIYYGTQYAGRNNNQFALSDGSSSSSPVSLLHGTFSYKDLDEAEELASSEKEYPEIEIGRNSFSLTSQSFDVGSVGRSFKRNCDHSFGLLYYDERGRPGEPVNLGSHFVPQIPDSGLAHIVLKIESDPPEWAHNYKVLYGGNTSISEFVQYTAGGAFVPKNAEQDKGLIYVSLNYLQENVDVSYSKSFGAVGADGDKDLYTFSEGDRLRIVSFFIDPDNPAYPSPGNPYEFQVVGTATLNDDASQNPLAVEGDEVHPAKTGQFVIIKDNSEASGFSFADVAGSLSDLNTTDTVYDNNNYWNRRCVFEIYSPNKKKESESRVYHEIGKTYNVVRSESTGLLRHQTETILIDQGDVYFRKMAVNMQDYDEENNQFVGLIGDGTATASELTAPNFRSFHLESKSFTDIFPNTDVLPNGKPRVAVENKAPIKFLGNILTQPTSNYYLRSSSIKFSDRSNSNSNIVRYTSFNDSKLPFKDLQTNEGEIFFLVNRNDSVFCIQRLKCSSIPVARNILSDALGNETVISTSKVLGTEKYYAGSYGSETPTSVAVAGNSIYFVSVRNKEVYRFNPSSGIEVISDKGMSSFFDEMLTATEDAVNSRLVGGYDPHADEFILSSFEGVETLNATGEVLYPNTVSNVNVPDPTGFEVFQGFEEEDPGSDVISSDALDVIIGLQGDIDNIVDAVESQDETMVGLVSDIETLDDLLDTDFQGFSEASAPISFTTSDGNTVTIGPFQFPDAYQNALESIRIDTLEKIQGLVQAAITNRQSLAESRRSFISISQASSLAIGEAKETFSALADVIDVLLEDERIDVSAFIDATQVDALRNVDLLDENAFDNYFNNPGLYSLLGQGEVPLSGELLFQPSINAFFEGAGTISLSLAENLNVEIPEIDALAFSPGFTNASNSYINAVSNLANIPDVSSMVSNIIQAAQFQASELAIIDYEAENESASEQIEAARAARDLALKAFVFLTKVLDVYIGGVEQNLLQDISLEEIDSLISEVDLADANVLEILDNAISGAEDVQLTLDAAQLTPSEGDSLFKTILGSAVVFLSETNNNSTQGFDAARDYLLASSAVTDDPFFPALSTLGEISPETLQNSNAPLKDRAKALELIINTLSFWPVNYLAGFGPAKAGLSPGEMMEWLKAWFDVGVAVNEVIPEGTDPSNPGLILDGATPSEFINANTPINISIEDINPEPGDPTPVAEITFAQLVNIFRKGLISQDQARLIFRGLRQNNDIYAFDSNWDYGIGSADNLDFLLAFGVDAFGEEIAGQFNNFLPVKFSEDEEFYPGSKTVVRDFELGSSPFGDQDVTNISGFD
jgi:hypothetical protein